jgi:hypothetical protein
MPSEATPLITLTATLNDVTGIAVGNVANPSKIRVDLCNFGPSLPTIAGFSVIVQIQQVFLATVTPGQFNFKLWANDQITPKATLYCFTPIDQWNRPLQSALYSINANGEPTNIDLSDLAPILAPPGQLIYEIPTGLIPGSAFYLEYPPYNNQLIALYYNGIFQRPGAPPLDYTVAGNTITLNFQATQENSVQAVYVTSGLESIGLPISEQAQGAFPGSVYTISRAPLNSQLIGLWYNGIFQRPGLDYSITGTTITLTFSTYQGGNIYVAYIPA